MQKVVTNKQGSFLIPNKEHQNFTDSNTKFRVGTPLYGEYKIIKGKRRGQDFDYRLFFTVDGKVVYANCVTPTNEPIEVVSNGDGTATIIDPSKAGVSASGVASAKTNTGAATTVPTSAIKAPSKVVNTTTASNVVIGDNDKVRDLSALWLLGIGAVGGFVYAKNKNFNKNKTIIYAIGGGVVLWGAYKTFVATKK